MGCLVLTRRDERYGREGRKNGKVRSTPAQSLCECEDLNWRLYALSLCVRVCACVCVFLSATRRIKISQKLATSGVEGTCADCESAVVEQ